MSNNSSFEQTTTAGAKTRMTVASDESVHVTTDEHQQLLVPSSRAFRVDGELRVDGSFVLVGI